MIFTKRSWSVLPIKFPTATRNCEVAEKGTDRNLRSVGYTPGMMLKAHGFAFKPNNMCELALHSVGTWGWLGRRGGVLARASPAPESAVVLPESLAFRLLACDTPAGRAVLRSADDG